MAEKYLAIHGHFYQPPRQDPFSGRVPREQGAEPYHDFNEKIDAECYRPNAEAGNFRHISFNIGPTLAAWLQKHDAPTYESIVAADRAHYHRFGYGNAIAQAYNHTILPLSSSRDKRIQIAWGVADFVHRFGHPPEGMWLGETAVDYATLSLLADAGIRFTILAPWQAASAIDMKQPYMVPLPKGKSIAVFFFDDRLSAAVSFDDAATSNADVFAGQLLATEVDQLKAEKGEPQLLFIATDGEAYGHHKPFRDKFLSYLLTTSAPREGFEVVSLARYLHLHPPQREVLLEEDTSWSCHHGVKRWRGACDCVEGGGTWKWYLRHALNKLANRIDDAYRGHAAVVFTEPWRVLDNYIKVRLGEISLQALFKSHQIEDTAVNRRDTMRLVEAQYYRQLMFTSCGFFFDDLDRIEPRNNIAFAARAIDSMSGVDPECSLEDQFVKDLAAAKSWKTGRTGAEMYTQLVAKRRQRLQRASVLCG
ncbi:MAG: DUF3536 domain-containing protein [Chloroflexi bacterium]|nr:DUF3536 domain-containing protein [Chloroflexota bacterium]